MGLDARNPDRCIQTTMAQTSLQICTVCLCSMHATKQRGSYFTFIVLTKYEYSITVNSEIFTRVLFFAKLRICENKILVKWLDLSVVC